MNKANQVLKAKRCIKKILSIKTAFKILGYVKVNFPKDEKMIKRMERQIKCSNRLEVYSNDVVRSMFCKQKTCLICNSIRLAKFLDKYLDEITKGTILYHIVLTVRNPQHKQLKKTINKMYGFFRNSAINKNKDYRELNKKVKMIRSFEATLNESANTYHIHFHILLASKNEQEVNIYGNLLIEYWMKYFGDKAHKDAQYLEKQERSILENFKYLFKMNDISDNNISMVYHLLKALEGKRLFLAKNIKLDKEKIRELKSKKYNDIENAKIDQTFRYHKEDKNWIDDLTGEIFVIDNDYEKLKQENTEKKNKRNSSYSTKKQSKN